jgi:hypothetical protein
VLTAPPLAAPSEASPPADLTAWRAILDRVRQERPALAAVLEHAVPMEVRPERVLLGYAPGDFLGAQAAEEEAALLLQREVRAHFGVATKVEIDLSLRAAAAQTVASIDDAKRKGELAAARAAVQTHPLVRQAMQLFGAELREVRVPGDEDSGRR